MVVYMDDFAAHRYAPKSRGNEPAQRIDILFRDRRRQIDTRAIVKIVKEIGRAHV